MYPHTPKKKSLAPPEGTLDILIFTQNRPSRTLPTFFRQGILIGGPILYKYAAESDAKGEVFLGFPGMKRPRFLGGVSE